MRDRVHANLSLTSWSSHIGRGSNFGRRSGSLASVLSLLLVAAVLGPITESAVAAPATLTEEAVLLPATGIGSISSPQRFGNSVSLSGDTLAIGAPGALNHGFAFQQLPGQVYVFTRTPTGWAEQARFNSSAMSERDDFGISVALSGDTLVAIANDCVGFSCSNHAYVFDRTGTTWTETQILSPAAGKGFEDVAFDGTRIVLGGDDVSFYTNPAGSWVLEDEVPVTDGVVDVAIDGGWAVGGNATNSYTFQRSGSTWTMAALASPAEEVDISGDVIVADTKVFRRSGSTWSEEAELVETLVVSDAIFCFHSCLSVAVDGDTIVLGSEQSGHSPGFNDGWVEVYVHDGAGNWTSQGVWHGSNPIIYDNPFPGDDVFDSFGAAVDIEGDELAVGAYQWWWVSGAVLDKLFASTGRTYTYQRTGTTWVETAMLALELPPVVQDWGGAGGNSSEDHDAVDIDGDWAAIGSSTGLNGERGVWLFHKSAGAWSEHSVIYGCLPVRFDCDGFGTKIALSGNRLLVGGSGGAWVYEFDGSTWSSAGTLDTPTTGLFLPAVALDGDVAFVVAGSEVHEYRWNGSSWALTVIAPAIDPGNLGSTLAFDGDYLAVSGGWYASDPVVIIFEKVDGVWTEKQTITGPFTGMSNWNFGMRSISLSGDSLLVGGHSYAESGDGSEFEFEGAGYLYRRGPTSWALEATLLMPTPEKFARLGWSTALYGDVAVLGAHTYDAEDPKEDPCCRGGLFVFERSGTTWTYQQTVIGDDTSNLGASLAIDGATVIAGAPSHPNTYTADGAVFVYSGDWVLPVPEPAISITKTASPVGPVLAGTDVGIGISVLNTGNVDLTSIVVDDDSHNQCDKTITAGDLAAFGGVLPPSEFFAYGCTVNDVTVDVTDTATVTAAVVGNPSNTVTDSDSATIDVVNPAIVITKGPDQTVFTGNDATITISVSNTGDVDLENVAVDDDTHDQCDKTIGALASGATTEHTCTVTNVTADVTDTATVNGNMAGHITYTVTDSDSAIITVTDSNSAPVLGSIGNQTVAEGATLDVAITATDLDGNALSFTVSGEPAFATLTDHGGGTATLSLAPGFGDGGTYPGVTVTVFDGTVPDAEAFTITVTADTTDPVVTITTPANGASFAQGAIVLAAFSCADEAGGSGLASCAGTAANGAAIATATAGAKAFTVAGTDNAGHTTTVTHNYTVVATPPPPPPTVADTVGVANIDSGKWYLANAAGTVTDFDYGNPGDLPISGNWDGPTNTTSTPGLYRSVESGGLPGGFFYARNSNSTGIANDACFGGNPSDIPVSGDWDGDGDDTLGIMRLVNNQPTFYLFNNSCVGTAPQSNPFQNALGAAQISFEFGDAGDTPVVGDWDGDGQDEIGLYRRSNGFFYNRNTPSTGAADNACFAGDPSDYPIGGDWDGDGDGNFGIFRPADQKFFLFTKSCVGLAPPSTPFANALGAAEIEVPVLVTTDTAYLASLVASDKLRPVSGAFGLG